MVKAMKMKVMKEKSGYQMDEFDVGQVKAHMHHDLKSVAISRIMYKKDGKTRFSEQAILDCMNKLRSNPSWRGHRASGSGPPRQTTSKQDEKVINWCLENRGKEKVTVDRLKRHFRFLRKFSDWLVEDRLHEAELAWLRRPAKTVVAKMYLQERIEYCRAVKRKQAATLLKWCYTDGVVFYLDRTEAESESSQRAALGSHVWRKSDNKDAMCADCIGPSAYSKGQGVPVRVWGMLALGTLHIHILEEGEVMNQDVYAELVEDKFETWAAGCEFLVCDYERCLRTDLSLHQLAKANLTLVDPYPRSSQDFNAIENAWKELRFRLDQTMPTHLEHRDEFVQRLTSAVKWLNTHRSHQLWKFCNNQKERADECLGQKPPGGRTSW